jgi:hypothetical protein
LSHFIFRDFLRNSSCLAAIDWGCVHFAGAESLNGGNGIRACVPSRWNFTSLLTAGFEQTSEQDLSVDLSAGTFDFCGNVVVVRRSPSRHSQNVVGFFGGIDCTGCFHRGEPNLSAQQSTFWAPAKREIECAGTAPRGSGLREIPRIWIMGFSGIVHEPGKTGSHAFPELIVAMFRGAVPIQRGDLFLLCGAILDYRDGGHV